MAWRVLAGCVVSVALLATVAPSASARLPPLKNACKLATDAEIKQLMGRKPVAKRGRGPEGCVWTTRPARYGEVEQGGRSAEDAWVTTTNYGNVREAKELFDLLANPDGPCRAERDLPGARIGNESAIVCSNTAFRLGPWVVEVGTFTNDVEEASPGDFRRTRKLARKVAKRIRGYRCGAGPPTCPR